ncbi:MAG: hypothetical protein ACRDRH_10855 [Pseudonocardia sp.]
MLVALRYGDVVAGARLALWDREPAKGDVRCVVGAPTLISCGSTATAKQVVVEDHLPTGQ